MPVTNRHTVGSDRRHTRRASRIIPVWTLARPARKMEKGVNRLQTEKGGLSWLGNSNHLLATMPVAGWLGLRYVKGTEWHVGDIAGACLSIGTNQSRISISGGSYLIVDYDPCSLLGEGQQRTNPKMIRYSKPSAKSGALTVRLGEFAQEVVAQVNQAPGHEQVASDKWKAVLAATSHRYEVAIIEADWAAYEQRNPPSEPAPKKKSKLGRPQKNWKDLCVIIGAYIIKHHQVSPGR